MIKLGAHPQNTSAALIGIVAAVPERVSTSNIGTQPVAALSIWALCLGFAGFAALVTSTPLDPRIACVIAAAAIWGWRCEVDAMKGGASFVVRVCASASHFIRFFIGLGALIALVSSCVFLFRQWPQDQITGERAYFTQFILPSLSLCLVIYGYAGHLRWPTKISAATRKNERILTVIAILLLATATIITLIGAWGTRGSSGVDINRNAQLHSTLSKARTTVTNFHMEKGRFPDEFDSRGQWSSSDLTHTILVGSGILKVPVPGSNEQRFVYLIGYENDSSPHGLSFLCVHDDPTIFHRPGLPEAPGQCQRLSGLDVRNLAKSRTQAALAATIARQKTKKPMTQFSVYFRLGRSEQSDMGMSAIEKAADISANQGELMQHLRLGLARLVPVNTMPPRAIDIVGFTDSTGTPEYNTRLSLARAESVRELLVELGVPLTSISVRGAGVDSPKAVCSAACSRRVEIRLHP